MRDSKGKHSVETRKHSISYAENQKTSIVINDGQLSFVIEIHLQI